MSKKYLFFLVAMSGFTARLTCMEAWKELLFADIKACVKTHVANEEQQQAQEKMGFLEAQKEIYNWRWQTIKALQKSLKENKAIEIAVVGISNGGLLDPNAPEESVFIQKEFLNCNVAELEMLKRKIWYWRGKKHLVSGQ